jgi:hypothetical protein
MENVVTELAFIKDDLVFVGSIVNLINKKTDKVNDIDIVVNSMKGLETFGDTIVNQSRSIHSKSGKRSQIVYKGVKIDIFIEDELPPYNIIGGIKYATIDHMVNHYIELLGKTDNSEMKSIIQSKIDSLK